MNQRFRMSAYGHGSRRRRARLATAVVGVLALLAAPIALVASPAHAGPVDTGWAASGPGTVSLVSDGTASAAAFTYNLQNAGLNTTRSWDFTATATSASANGTPVQVPYTWQGLHAWFQVTTKLDMVVNGNVAKTLVIAGPTSCCTTPSNGFLYGGLATFDGLAPGDHYGFRLSGRNGDFNNFLQGHVHPQHQALHRRHASAPTTGTGRVPHRCPRAPPRWWCDGHPRRAGRGPLVPLPGRPRPARQRHPRQPPADYDMALYGDVGAAFEQLTGGTDVTSLAAGASAGAPGSGSQTPEYSSAVTDIPTKDSPPSGQTFAPRVYAPRVYAPRVYAPRVYAPRVYAPRVYAPRVYAPDSYAPDLPPTPPSSKRSPPPRTRPCWRSRRTPAQDSETVLGLDRQHQRVLLRPCPGSQRPGLRHRRRFPPRPHHLQHGRLRQPRHPADPATLRRTARSPRP